MLKVSFDMSTGFIFLRRMFCVLPVKKIGTFLGLVSGHIVEVNSIVAFGFRRFYNTFNNFPKVFVPFLCKVSIFDVFMPLV